MTESIDGPGTPGGGEDVGDAEHRCCETGLRVRTRAVLDGEEESKTTHREGGPADQGGEEGAKSARKEKYCEHEEAPMMCDRR